MVYTEKIFLNNSYVRSIKANVIQTDLTDKQYWAVKLDKTVFFPESGGQPCDLGEIEGIPCAISI